MNDVGVLLLTPLSVAATALYVLLMVAWTTICARRNWRRVWLLPHLVVATTALVLWCFGTTIDWDEIESLHAAWLVDRGRVAYVDFWQHHSPLLYRALGPLVRAGGDGSRLLLLTRAAGLLLFLPTAWLGWRIARRAWGERASPRIYGVVLLGPALMWQFAWLRADSFALLLILLATDLTLGARADHRLRWIAAGAALTLGLSFTYKHGAFLLLPMLAAALVASEGRWRRIGLVAAGCVVGAVPLVTELLRTDTLEPFLRWVVRFNAGLGRPALVLEIGIVAAVAAAAGPLRRRMREADGRGALILFAALVLALPGSLVSVQWGARYYLSLLYVLAACVAAGLSEQALLAVRGRRTVLLRVVVASATALLVLPAAAMAWSARGGLADARAWMDAALRASEGRSVLSFNPEHPVYREDACWINLRWQLRFAGGWNGADDPGTARSPGGEDIVDAIRAARPALVEPAFEGEPLPEALESHRVIDRDGRVRLEAFLRENYRPGRVGGRTLLIAR